MLQREETAAAALCRRGWAVGTRGTEGMEGGAVLGPGSNWFCLSSEKACCKLTAPADWDKLKLGTGG